MRGPNGRLGRRCGRAGGEHDLGVGREGGGIIGQGRHSGHGHAQAEILEQDENPLALEGVQQVAQDLVLYGVQADGRGDRPVPADDRAHMAFDQFAGPLEDRFLKPVPGGRPVELVDLLEPIQGHMLLAVPGHVEGPDETPRHQIHDLGRGLWGKAVMHRTDDLLDGHDPPGPFGHGLGPGQLLEGLGRIPEMKKTEAFGQLHERRGLGLLRRGAFAHLLSRGHDAAGLFAADAQIDRDAEPAGVDAPGLGQDVRAEAAESGPGPGRGLGRGTDLVGIGDIAFGRETKLTHVSGLASG